MVDVIIVGAGIAGLTTAYKLLKKEPSLKVKIFEASDVIGGQIASVLEEEISGKWFIQNHYHLYNLLTELRLPIRRRSPISKSLKRCWEIDSGLFAPLVNYEVDRYIDDLDLRSQMYRPGTFKITEKDRNYTMWHHINGSLLFQSSRIFMMNLIRFITGADCRDICHIEFMSYLHDCGGLRPLVHMYLIQSTSTLEFSSEELLRALDNRLESVSIKTMARIIEIHHYPDIVQVREENFALHVAKVVVLAVPSSQINDIFISPPLPVEFNNPPIRYNSYITNFMVQYDEAYWRLKGFSGNFYLSNPIIYAQEYHPNSLIGYVIHERGYEYLTKANVLNSLASHFGNEMAMPVSYMQQTYQQPALRNLPQTLPCDRLVFASTSEATNCRGLLSGAVQSGFRAAVHVLLIVRPQNVTWRDLAEIQKADAVHDYPSSWSLIKSSINLYNVTFYSFVVLSLYCTKKIGEMLLRN